MSSVKSSTPTELPENSEHVCIAPVMAIFRILQFPRLIPQRRRFVYWSLVQYTAEPVFVTRNWTTKCVMRLHSPSEDEKAGERFLAFARNDNKEDCPVISSPSALLRINSVRDLSSIIFSKQNERSRFCDRVISLNRVLARSAVDVPKPSVRSKLIWFGGWDSESG
jgi:hypothetical protein